MFSLAISTMTDFQGLEECVCCDDNHTEIALSFHDSVSGTQILYPGGLQCLQDKPSRRRNVPWLLN